MELKAGYRKTEVGAIPYDWDVKCLTEVATEIGDGIHTTPDYVPSSMFFFINGNNLIEGKISITEKTMCVSEIEYLRLKKNLNNQSILMSINGTIGNLAFYNGEKVVLGKSAAYINISWNNNRTYIYYSLMSAATTNYIENELTGTTIRNLSLESLRNTPIPTPKIQEEQRAIAAALSDVDALIAALDRLIAKKRDIKHAAMQELLTGKRRLPGYINEKRFKKIAADEIPVDWDSRSFGDVAEIIMGQSPAGTSYNQMGAGIPLINGPTEFTDQYPIKIQWTTQPTKTCKNGDLLLCVRGSSTGRMNISNDIYCIGRGVAAIRAKSGSDTKFLTYLLHSAIQKLLSFSTGSTFPNIDRKAISSIQIGLPSFPEQHAIALVLSDIDAEIAALENRRKKNLALKQGMMQELLTGRIRLVQGGAA